MSTQGLLVLSSLSRSSMGNTYDHSELDNILQTLAQAVPSPQHSARPSQQNLSGQQVLQVLSKHSRAEDVDLDAYDPADFVPLEIAKDGGRRATTQVIPQSSSTSSDQTTPVDARTIITWKPALRHVTRLVSRERAVQDRIRKLCHAQREHEKQWWQSREALIQQQLGRVESRKKLGELLYVCQVLREDDDDVCLRMAARMSSAMSMPLSEASLLKRTRQSCSATT